MNTESAPKAFEEFGNPQNWEEAKFQIDSMLEELKNEKSSKAVSKKWRALCKLLTDCQNRKIVGLAAIVSLLEKKLLLSEFNEVTSKMPDNITELCPKNDLGMHLAGLRSRRNKNPGNHEKIKTTNLQRLKNIGIKVSGGVALILLCSTAYSPISEKIKSVVENEKTTDTTTKSALSRRIMTPRQWILGKMTQEEMPQEEMPQENNQELQDVKSSEVLECTKETELLAKQSLE